MADIVQVSQGLRKERLKEGTGAKPSAGNTITVSCTGSIAATGKKFWRYTMGS